MDANWEGDLDSQHSTTGYILMLGNTAISWKSKSQSILAMSFSEAEFVAASALVQEVRYLSCLLARLGFPQEGPTRIFEDNETCCAWFTGMVGGIDKSKHMDLHKHFLRDAVEAKIVTLEPIPSALNAVDIFTKPNVQKQDFLKHCDTIFGAPSPI